MQLFNVRLVGTLMQVKQVIELKNSFRDFFFIIKSILQYLVKVLFIYYTQDT